MSVNGVKFKELCSVEGCNKVAITLIQTKNGFKPFCEDHIENVDYLLMEVI